MHQWQFVVRSIWFCIEEMFVSSRNIPKARRLQVHLVIAFSFEWIGGFAFGKFGLHIAWCVCTCLPRGNQVDGLPRAIKWLKNIGFYTFSWFLRIMKFHGKKHVVFIGFPGFEETFEKVRFRILNGAGVLQYVLRRKRKSIIRKCGLNKSRFPTRPYYIL